jgi:hypothetical protein
MDDILKNIQNSKTIIELLYSLEALCYYFNMKPHEFWNSTYREIKLFCQMNLIKYTDDFKLQITLQDETTNKIIKANPMLYKNPKINSLKEVFRHLFKQKEEEQTIEEQIALLRGMK